MCARARRSVAELEPGVLERLLLHAGPRVVARALGEDRLEPLQALNSGLITKTEFLDLNEKIGGLDVDGNPIGQKLERDPQRPEIIRTVYGSGYLFASAVVWTEAR